MRLIKTKPQTEAQLENYNRYGLAIIITATLGVLVQLLQMIADFYSLYPPFLKKFVAASPQYGGVMAAVVALAIPGLIAFATHFLFQLSLQMYFNGKYKSPDTVLFAIVCISGALFAGAQYYVSTEGGKNAATENFGYKANLRNESEVDNMYQMEVSTATTLFRADSSTIAQNYVGQLQNAQSRLNNGKEAEKNWLRGQLSAVQAEKANEMKAIQNVRNKAVNEAMERKKATLSEIKAHNGKEVGKADMDEEKYSTAGKWVAIILIPLFAFLKWLNSKFNHICGIEIQVVSSEHDFDTSIWGKMWYAISDALKGQLNNGAVWLHDKFRPKELYKFADPGMEIVQFKTNEMLNNTHSTQVVTASNDTRPVVGFKLPEKKDNPPQPEIKQKFERETVDGKVQVTAHFETVPPFVIQFDNDAAADKWERHIHPDVPIDKKTMAENAVQNANIQVGTVTVLSDANCLNCSKPLLNSRSHKRQYCDTKCRNEAYTQRTGKTVKLFKSKQDIT